VKLPAIDDAFFRGKALLLVEDPLTRTVLSQCWKMDPRARDITVRPVGGNVGVQRLVMAARELDHRHVFGLVDRDFDGPAGAGAPVLKTGRHEIENHLLDYDVLAKVSLNTSAAAIEQVATARATDLRAWMAVRKTLVEMKVEIPGMPGDPKVIEVPDEAAAKAWLKQQSYPEDAEKIIRTKWTKLHLNDRLPVHYEWCANEVTTGRWFESFSGKEIFRHVRSVVPWRFPLASDEDLAFKVAEHWRDKGTVPAFIDGLRDTVLAGSGL
jgi:hypothetical protein